MNKYIKFAAVACIGFALTGCGGGKKISCTRTEEDSFEGKSTEKITYEFSKDGNSIEKYIEESSVKFTDKYLEYQDEDIEYFAKSAESTCEDYEDSEITTCDVKVDGKKITMTLTLNLKGLDEEDLNDMYKDKDITYSEYSKAKKVIDAKYDKTKKDTEDKDESLFKYSCK